MTPIAVCSPKNFALAKSNGAKEVFDRNDKECAQKIVGKILDPLLPSKRRARYVGCYSCRVVV